MIKKNILKHYNGEGRTMTQFTSSQSPSKTEKSRTIDEGTQEEGKDTSSIR